MEFKLKSILDLKNWFCGKTDDELAQYLITHLINDGECADIFLRSLPESLRNNWILTLCFLSGKKVLFPLGTDANFQKMFIELQLRYKNCTHHELNRIRAEFCKHVDSFV